MSLQRSSFREIPTIILIFFPCWGPERIFWMNRRSRGEMWLTLPSTVGLTVAAHARRGLITVRAKTLGKRRRLSRKKLATLHPVIFQVEFDLLLPHWKALPSKLKVRRMSLHYPTMQKAATEEFQRNHFDLFSPFEYLKEFPGWTDAAEWLNKQTLLSTVTVAAHARRWLITVRAHVITYGTAVRACEKGLVQLLPPPLLGYSLNSYY